MIKLQVIIEICGENRTIGEIVGNNSLDARFRYSGEYIRNGQPISISLPLKAGFFTADETQNFFEGLLPEGFTRRTLTRMLHTEESDYITVLKALGSECIGALRISDADATDEPGYEKLEMQRIKELAAEGAVKSAQTLIKTHLSLAGASGKAGLYYDESSDEWYLPKGTNPSTHIVKQSHIRFNNIVVNEQLCLMTASRLGIEVPHSFIINTGEARESDILFATKRYDRIMPSGKDITCRSGLPVPLRLHQEDFAQAGGIPSALKYESEGTAYLKMMMDILRRHSSDPIKDQEKLWKMICYSCLIGNTDAHIKNFSLLYSSDLKSVRLAPAYDIISTIIYPESTRRMSFRIGNTDNIDHITDDSFISAAQECGTGTRTVQSVLENIRNNFEAAINESADELQHYGFNNALSVRNSILENCALIQ